MTRPSGSRQPGLSDADVEALGKAAGTVAGAGIRAAVPRFIGFGVAVLGLLVGSTIGFFGTGWTGLFVGAIIGTVGWMIYNIFKIIATVKGRSYGRFALLNAALVGSPIFALLGAAHMHSLGRGVGLWSVIVLVILVLMALNGAVFGLAVKKAVKTQKAAEANATANATDGEVVSGTVVPTTPATTDPGFGPSGYSGPGTSRYGRQGDRW